MAKRLLLFVLAAAIFLAGAAVFSLLSNIPTSREKKAQAEIRDAENRLRREYGVLAVLSGFQRRTGGNGDVYVPSVLVRVANLTDAPSSEIAIRAEFSRAGRGFCRDRNSVPELKPGESWDLWLTCIEPTGFGSVAWGLPLAETAEPMTFAVYLDTDRISVLMIAEPMKSAFF